MSFKTLHDIRMFTSDNGFTIEDIAFFIYRIDPSIYETLFVIYNRNYNEPREIFDTISENNINIDCFALLMEMIRRIHILEFLKHTKYEDVEFYAQRYLTEEEYRDIQLHANHKNKRRMRHLQIEMLMNVINCDELSKCDYDHLIEDSHAWFRQSKNATFAFQRYFHR